MSLSTHFTSGATKLAKLCRTPALQDQCDDPWVTSCCIISNEIKSIQLEKKAKYKHFSLVVLRCSNDYYCSTNAHGQNSVILIEIHAT